MKVVFSSDDKRNDFVSAGISHFPEPSAWSCHVKNILKSYQNNYFAHEKTLQQRTEAKTQCLKINRKGLILRHHYKRKNNGLNFHVSKIELS